MKKQILVVDDSPIMRKLLSEVLSSEYTVATAGDGYEALEYLFKASAVDVMLLDLSMPRMDGVELLHKIKNMAAFIKLPVLVLSGHYESSLRISAIKAGANDLMTKPFNPVELKIRLEKLIQDSQASANNVAQTNVIQLTQEKKSCFSKQNFA